MSTAPGIESFEATKKIVCPTKWKVILVEEVNELPPHFVQVFKCGRNTKGEIAEERKESPNRSPVPNKSLLLHSEIFNVRNLDPFRL